MIRKTTLLGAIFLLCMSWVLAISASANILYVSQGGTGSGTYWWYNAAGSIQTAINNASSGDEIWVATGTYSANFSVPEGITIFGGFAGDEESSDERNWIAHVTTISCVSVSATGSSSDMAAIDGFKFTGCGSFSFTGNVVFSHNIVTGNTIPNEETPLITCSGPVMLINNLIYGNLGRRDSFVGIRCISNQGVPILTNNTIADNGVECALAIDCYDAAAILSNNIIEGGTGIYGNASLVLSHNCVYGCPCGEYVGFPLDWTPPATEINVDPQFIGAPNYRLQATSPCIDIQGANDAINSSSIPAFAKAKDLYGMVRIDNNYVDIGASEYYPTSSLSYSPPPSQYCTSECYSYKWVQITCSVSYSSIIYTVDGTEPDLTTLGGRMSTRVYDPTGYVRVPVPGRLWAKALLENGTPVAERNGYYSRHCESSPTYYTCWTWEDDTSPSVVPSYLRIDNVFPRTDIQQEGGQVTSIDTAATIRTSWDYSLWSNCNGWRDGGNYTTYQVKRKVGETETIFDPTTNMYFDDTDVDFGSTYQYAVRGVSYEEPLPSYLYPEESYYCPSCSDPYCFRRIRRTNPGPWSSYITVTTAKVPVEENQTVDSRIDTRKDDDVLINFDFQDKVYRGGLFVGAIAEPDQSRVGRSFLKFAAPTLPTGTRMWMGALNLFYTGSVDNDVTTTVGCQLLDNDSWVDHGEECITWEGTQTLFPNFAPSNGIDTVTVGGSGIQANNWCRWDSALKDLMWGGDQYLTYGLALKQEPDPLVVVPAQTKSWAYFAKKEYAQALAPCITYAYSDNAHIRVIDITLSQGEVEGGNAVTGTVWLNAPAPTGGKRVYITGSRDAYGPSGGVLVPAGEHSANFTVSTAIVNSETVADVSVCSEGYTVTRKLTLKCHEEPQ